MSSATQIAEGLSRRYKAEKRFRMYGIGAIALALGFLAVLLVVVFARGFGVLQ
ncbi:MAG: DUF3333 domain-containing protein, partial [Rhodospirillaceae bacterium]|nr:DUF3333 domain-containing protein [Rhodospirillaceae bacterium]